MGRVTRTKKKRRRKCEGKRYEYPKGGKKKKSGKHRTNYKAARKGKKEVAL